MKDEWSSSGISQAVKFTGEPAPRAAKSSSISPFMDGSPLSESLLLHDSGSVEEGAKGMSLSVLGTDLGKNSCSVVGLDATGKVVVSRRM